LFAGCANTGVTGRAKDGASGTAGANGATVKLGFVGLGGGAFKAFKSCETELGAEMTYLSESDFRRDTLPDVSGFDAVFILFPAADLGEQYSKSFSEAVKKNPDLKIFLLRDAGDIRELFKGLENRGSVVVDRDIIGYYGISHESMKNLIRYALITYFGRPGKVDPPGAAKIVKIYHPEGGEFETIDEFLKWAESAGWDTRNAPRVVVTARQHHYLFHQPMVINQIMEELVKEKILAVCLIDTTPGFNDLVIEFDPHVIVQTSATFANVDFLQKVGVPVIHGVWFMDQSIGEWQMNDENGMTEGHRQWQISVNEYKGAAEFLTSGGTMSGGGSGEEIVPIDDRIKRIAGRVKAWTQLAMMKNSEKKISFIYYDQSMDKSGLMRGSGHYLNAPRSMVNLLKVMAGEGYDIRDIPSDDNDLLERLMDHGRQMGAWEKGNLERLAESGEAVLITEEKYLKWFNARVPERRREEVNKYWGAPPGGFMVWEKDGERFIVVPRVEMGKIILLPQPLKGEAHTTSAAFKLAHDRHIPPPHNYLATYFWLEEEFGADALVHFGTHGSEWLFPGKPDVLSESDWSDILISNMPNINPWMANNTGEIAPCRRRAMAVLVSILPPAVVDAGLSDELLNIESDILKWRDMEDSALRKKFEASITEQVAGIHLDRDVGIEPGPGQLLNEDEIEDVFMYIHNVKNEVIPPSLHVLGEPPASELLIPYIVHCMGKRYLDASKEVFRVPPGVLEEDFLKEKALKVVGMILNRGGAPAESLKAAGGILKNGELPEKVKEGLELAVALNEGFKQSGKEIDSILDALNAKFVLPGPSGDPARNPAVVPSGRNMYTMNPDEIPSRPSWDVATKLIDEYLAEEVKSKGAYPRKIGFSLIPLATYGDYGVIESQVLYLMGVRPVWDKNNTVQDIELIPPEDLGRPRIDVFLSMRNVYRDQLPSRMELLDRAVRLVASLEEKDNYVYENSLSMKEELEGKGVPAEKAQALSRARIFGWAPGEMANSWYYYLVERSGEWDTREDLLDVYLSHCRHVYTEGMWGEDAPDAYNAAISGTDLILRSWHDSRSTPLGEKYGWWVDGSLAMAVENITGKKPDLFFVDVRDMDSAKIVDSRDAVAMDFRARLFNRKWIEGMMDEGYAGADLLAEHVSNTMGWEIVSPEFVTDEHWMEITDVYVRDSKELGLGEWFEEENPFAFQDLTEVMLETIRKEFWQPDAETVREIVEAYTQSVVRHGRGNGIRSGENKKLEEFIREQLSAPGLPESDALLEQYEKKTEEATELKSNRNLEQVKGKKLVNAQQDKPERMAKVNRNIILAIALMFFIIIAAGYMSYGIAPGRKR